MPVKKKEIARENFSFKIAHEKENIARENLKKLPKIASMSIF